MLPSGELSGSARPGPLASAEQLESLSRMDILFDTSAVNRLHDDPAGGSIVNGLLATNVVRVSALNVLEAARTADIGRRRSLLRWLKFMTGNERPLEMANVLARRAVAQYGRRAPLLNWSIDHEADVLWQVLVDPESVDEGLRSDLNEFQHSLEADFRQCHERARPDFERLFGRGTRPPARPSDFLREYLERPEALHQLINDWFYRDTVGSDLPADETLELFRVVPEIAGFLLGWGHSIHQRALASQGYGAYTNAGIVDLWFATYLGRVDRFVTADDRQYAALRLISRIVPDGRTSPRAGPHRVRRSVTRYDAYRRQLLVPAAG